MMLSITKRGDDTLNSRPHSIPTRHRRQPFMPGNQVDDPQVRGWVKDAANPHFGQLWPRTFYHQNG